MEFTDDEIREELARLGYENVPHDKLQEFKTDLLKLIDKDRSKNTSLNSSVDEHSESRSPVVRDSSEFVAGNFTNHGSQWIDQHYDYLEEKRPGRLAKSASAARSASSMSAASSARPVDLDRDFRKDNYNQSSCMKDGPQQENNVAKCIKRKTLRVADDGCRRVDESFTESETDGVFEIYEKIKNMAMRDCECGKSRSTSATEDPPYRLKGKKNPYPSFIKKPERPKNQGRTMSYERMRFYQKTWKKQEKASDEARSKLYRDIHLKMLQKDEIKLDHKVYIPNRYEVPTDKTRTALRWQVRHCIENFEMPPRGFYHEI